MEKSENKMMKYVNNTQKLYTYLKEKALSHNHYKFYSSIDRIIDIRDNKNLYLGNGKKWNDILDRENFNSDNYYVNFGKCFSYLKEEYADQGNLYALTEVGKENSKLTEIIYNLISRLEIVCLLMYN